MVGLVEDKMKDAINKKTNRKSMNSAVYSAAAPYTFCTPVVGTIC